MRKAMVVLAVFMVLLAVCGVASADRGGIITVGTAQAARHSR